MVCVLFVAVQAIRVCFFGAGAEASALESALIQNMPSAGITLEGTVFKIEEKSKVTAVCLKDNAVSVSDQKIQEPTIMAYVRPEQTEKTKNTSASGTGSGYPGRPLFLTARAIRGISTSARTMPGRGSMSLCGRTEWK